MTNDAPYFPPPPSYTFLPTPGATHTTSRFFHGHDDSSNSFHPASGPSNAEGQDEKFSLPRRQSTWRILPTSRFWSLVDNWWLWELISWSFAAACLIATIALLGAFQGQRLPAWPWGLTINAYVSILGAFMKAALLLPTAEALGQLKFNWFATHDRDIYDFQLFDQASRGPWGAFALIIRTRGRALAALGAAVIVLSIALDPFFQQVVVYPSRTMPVGNSTILRARSFSASQFDPAITTNGSSFFFPDRALYYFVQPMMLMTHTPPAPSIPLSCSTGNCSWDPFESLGVCNKCADISHLLDFGCFDSQNHWLSSSEHGVKHSRGPSCGYFLNATSHDRRLMTGYGISPDNNETLLGSLLSLSIPDANGVMSYYDTSINFRHITNTIADTIYVFSSDRYESVRANATPTAVECNVHWCIQTIQSSVREGELQEKVLAEAINTTQQNYPWSRNSQNEDLYYSAVPSTVSSSTGLSFGLTSNESAFQIITSFMEGSNSFITMKNKTADPQLQYGEEGGGATYTMAAKVSPWWTPANVTQHFDALAKKFSDVVRALAAQSDMMHGTAFGEETYVEIRWAWLSLPFALLIFSLFFLIAAMVQSRARGVEIWKTSAIAVLLHGIADPSRSNDGPSRAHLSRGRTAEGGTQADQKRLRVTLKRREGRWRFSRHPQRWSR